MTLVRITPFWFVASVLIGIPCLVVACSSDEVVASAGDGGPAADAASSTGGRNTGGSHTGGRSSGGTAGSGGRSSGGTPNTDAGANDSSSGSGGAATGGASGAGGATTGGAPTTGGAGGSIAAGGSSGSADSGLDAGTGGRGTTVDAATGGSTGCPRTDASIGFRCNAFAGIETYYEVATKRLWVHATIAPLAVSGRYYLQYRLVSDGTLHCASGDIQAQNGVPYIPWSGSEQVDRFRIGALELVDFCGQAYSFTAENGTDCDAVDVSPVSDASTIWSSSCVSAGAGPCATPSSCP